MADKFVFELIEEIDFSTSTGVLYWRKEDAWKRICYIVDKFIEIHKDIDITRLEIDYKRFTVWLKFIDKKTGTTHYRSYEIYTRSVY